MFNLAKTCIENLRITQECIVHNDANYVVCEYAIPHGSSKVSNPLVIFSMLHFIRNPITQNNAVILWSNSVAHISSSDMRVSAENIANTIQQKYGNESAYIDDDNDFRIKLMVENVSESESVKVCLQLTVTMIQEVTYVLDNLY